VRAAYLQNGGIGRGMKVGKEGIAGTIAALQAWEQRDHAAVRAAETRALALWMQTLAARPGVTASLEPDPTNNPLDRLRLTLDPQEAHITAWDFADRLANGTTPVIVRDHEIEHGFFYMDPCNLHPGEAAVVAQRLAEELDRSQASNEVVASSFGERRARRYRRMRSWPD
jgi:L-seryl-tRNA(Ser) seleniumtransferase